jgi:prolyl-tRNA synthetase
MGLPHRIVVGDRGLEKGLVEYRNRRESENQDIALADICSFVVQAIN